MSDMCPTCKRAWPREFDEIMVRRLVERGRQEGSTREDRYEAIRVMLTEGKLTRRDIGERMGVGARTVMRIADLYGIASTQPSQESVAEMASEMVRRYNDGQIISQIAVAMGRAESTVRKHLERAGCQFRGPGWKAAGG